MKQEPIARHTLKNIWVAYSKKLIKQNQNYRTTSKEGMVDSVYFEDSTATKIVVMTYEKFRSICERFLLRARKAVINGEAINIPSCGIIGAKRIQRDFRSKKKTVDWIRTTEAGYKILENGKRKYNKVFYQVQDEYLRIGWFKPTITNIEAYVFEPTHSSSKTHFANESTIGFKEDFAKANNADKLLKYRYIFCPIKDYVLKEGVK